MSIETNKKHVTINIDHKQQDNQSTGLNKSSLDNSFNDGRGGGGGGGAGGGGNDDPRIPLTSNLKNMDLYEVRSITLIIYTF